MMHVAPAFLLLFAQPVDGPTEAAPALELQRLKNELIELREDDNPALKWSPDRFGVDAVQGETAQQT